MPEKHAVPVRWRATNGLSRRNKNSELARPIIRCRVDINVTRDSLPRILFLRSSSFLLVPLATRNLDLHGS